MSRPEFTILVLLIAFSGSIAGFIAGLFVAGALS